jgi:multidrug resistance efflux pump
LRYAEPIPWLIVWVQPILPDKSEAGSNVRIDFANLISIAPRVEGPIVELKVHDNDFVRKGELLFVNDPRPYQYALEKAESAQSALEGQVSDEQRRVAAQVSEVSVANELRPLHPNAG